MKTITGVTETNISRFPKDARGTPHSSPLALFSLLFALSLLAASPLRAESAEGPPEGVLWSSLSFSAAAAPDSGSSASPGNTDFAALGFGLEYGVLPWFSLSADWQPGFIISGYSSAGSAGSFSDLSFAFRFSLLGEQGLLKFKPLRLSLSAGLDVPLPSASDSAWEPDAHLWGALGQLSFDYLPSSFFQLSGSASVTFNPEQASDNPAFSRQAVFHPLDVRAELEPWFCYLNPGGVIFSFPVVYEFSQESSVREEGLGDGGHLLSMGFGYTIAMREFALPFEASLKFLAPLYGVNRSLFQRVELTGKVAIPLKKSGSQNKE
jgi:hypothetical protein